MTLLEIMIVLAIIAGLAVLLVSAGRRMTDSELREETVGVASLLQVAYSLAAQTGLHHRVVFALSGDGENKGSNIGKSGTAIPQNYRVEVCQEAITLKRGEDTDESAKKEMLERLQNRPQSVTQLPELAGAESNEDMMKKAAALEGVRVGTASCAQAVGPEFGASGGSIYKRAVKSDIIKIDEVYTQHLDDSVRDGIVTVNFFPQGYAEKAVVVLKDKDGEPSYVIVHRLTGRIETKKGKYDPNDHMHRNALGDRESER